MGNKINLFRGEKNKYTQLYGVDLNNDIYFATDDKEILMGGDTYGGNGFYSKLNSERDDYSSGFNKIKEIQSSLGIGLKLSNSGNLLILGGIKYVDIITYTNARGEIDTQKHWNVPELCCTLSPVKTDLSIYDYNLDGKVDYKDISIFIYIILNKEAELQNIYSLYNVTPGNISNLKNAMLSAGKVLDVNDDNIINVLDLTSIINVIFNNADNKTIGYDLIFFNVITENNEYIKLELGSVFISTDDFSTQVNKEIENVQGIIKDGENIHRVNVPVQKILYKVPVEDPEEGELPYEIEELQVYSLNPLSYSENDFYVDDNNVLHVTANAGCDSLPYTFEYTNLDLTDSNSWYGSLNDESILDSLLDEDELPNKGILFSYIDNSLKILEVVSAREISRIFLYMSSSQTKVDCIACHFNLIRNSSIDPFDVEDNKACLLLARITNNDTATYHWAIGIEGQLTNPFKDAINKLQLYIPV